MKTVRIGILGAARIAPFALIKQARQLEDVEIVAVAEEYQPEAALQAYARKYGIPATYRSFRELLANKEIDAVYIPLPISFHARWVLEAIKAGKHVLCEKPMAANAEEAQAIHAAAQGTGLVVAEAMHFRYHPLVNRLRDILASGEIGEIQSVDAMFSTYIPFDNFRMKYPLGGGVTIDMGCYPLAFLRAVLDTEPEVTAAAAGVVAEHIDGWMDIDLLFPAGKANTSGQPVTAHVFTAMRSLRRPFGISMKFHGSEGKISLLNFIKPEVYHHMIIRGRKGFRIERVPGGSTYKTQLAAFIKAVQQGKPVLTNTENALLNMRVIDAVYEASGLPKRGLKL